jgi:hypothetical protein
MNWETGMTPPSEPEPTYGHTEAFCIMTYKCGQCGAEEKIWNSRDGVTPFVIICRECGGDAQHINWQQDVRDLQFVPPPGMRIFVNLHFEKAKEVAGEYVRRVWKDPNLRMDLRYKSPKNAVQKLAAGWYTDGKQPYLATIWEKDDRVKH